MAIDASSLLSAWAALTIVDAGLHVPVVPTTVSHVPGAAWGLRDRQTPV